MTDRTFDNKVAKLMALQEELDTITKQMDLLKEDIKAEMTARDTDRISTKKYSATWQSIISNRFDSVAFKKVHDDLYKMFSKSSETKRFTFKAVA